MPTNSVGDYAQVNEVELLMLNYNDAEENISVPNTVVSSGATTTDQPPKEVVIYILLLQGLFPILPNARIIAALGFKHHQQQHLKQRSKNSDITKAEIEAKLTGEITSSYLILIVAVVGDMTTTTTSPFRD
jgi:hypothetical protein